MGGQQSQNLDWIAFMQVDILSFKCKQVWTELCVFVCGQPKFCSDQVLVLFCFIAAFDAEDKLQMGVFLCIIGCEQHHLWTNFRNPLGFGGETFGRVS